MLVGSRLGEEEVAMSAVRVARRMVDFILAIAKQRGLAMLFDHTSVATRSRYIYLAVDH